MVKKAQFKIQQMAFMLVAVFLFFVLAGMFFLILQYRNIHEKATIYEENQKTLIAEVMANYPEFACGGDDATHCIDTDKVINFDATKYEDFFPVKSIEIRKVYPEETADIACNLANYPNCNVYNVYSEQSGKKGTGTAGSSVALCRWSSIGEYYERKCDLGRIIVGYDVK